MPRKNTDKGSGKKQTTQKPQAKPTASKKPRATAAKNKGVSAEKRNAVQTSKAAATPPKAKSELEQKQGVIKRLIETLKRVIGYKKGERDEFRYNNDTKHPGYIFKEVNGKYKSFGITHSEQTFGRKNMPLNINPDSSDTRQSYIRNGTISSKKERNSNKLKNFVLSQNDTANIKSKKRNYKKVNKRKKQKKKTSR